MPFPICTTEAGSAMGVPDVCKVPTPAGPVPTPFVNTAQLVMGSPPATALLIDGCPALTLSSKIPLSQGDQPGSAGGVVSGTIMGEVCFVRGSTCVFVTGSPAVYATCQTTHNKNNAVGLVVAPSQPIAFVGM